MVLLPWSRKGISYQSCRIYATQAGKESSDKLGTISSRLIVAKFKTKRQGFLLVYGVLFT